MDFDIAISKLSRDHNNLRKKSVKNQQEAQRLKRRAAQRQKLEDERRRVKDIQKRRLEKIRGYEIRMDALLKVKHAWSMKCMSIHGEGDKIALPPGILAVLSEAVDGGSAISMEEPLTFRVGIVDPQYQFPASQSMRSMMERIDGDDNDDNDVEDEEENSQSYLDELSHRYLSYTHATVLEFTQDEGFIGLPLSIASRLLSGRGSNVTGIKTVDPAAPEESKPPNEAAATAGHLAWGLFPIPSVPVEITLLTLPKGTGCTLKPSQTSLERGFGALKDIKAVLEQSLIRTRATLSLGDTLFCWHRGVKFDLTVVNLTPDTFHAVSCINTDIEVMLEYPKQEQQQLEDQPTTSPTPTQIPTTTKITSTTISLPIPPFHADNHQEPPPNAANICTIQIRSSTKSQQRRFACDNTMALVFAFAASLTTKTNDNDNDKMVPAFRLVTRFPRRVFEWEDVKDKTLEDVGLKAGREMLMVETV